MNMLRMPAGDDFCGWSGFDTIRRVLLLTSVVLLGAADNDLLLMSVILLG